MIGIVAVVVVAVIVAVVVAKKHKAIQGELDTILNDLVSTVDKLDTFAADKEVEIADHLDEIALHTKHVNVKQADHARAMRIRDKLNELLA